MRQQYVDLYHALSTQDGWKNSLYKLWLWIYTIYGDFYICFFATWFILSHILVRLRWIKNDLLRHVFCAILGYVVASLFVVGLDSYMLKDTESAQYNYEIPYKIPEE